MWEMMFGRNAIVGRVISHVMDWVCVRGSEQSPKVLTADTTISLDFVQSGTSKCININDTDGVACERLIGVALIIYFFNFPASTWGRD